MPDFEALAKDFFLEEAILEAIVLDREEDVYLVLKIYDGNITLAFEGDFSSRFPQERLILKCEHFVFFNIDRLRAYGTMKLLTAHDQETKPEVQEVRRTIIGWAFFTESEKLTQLGTGGSGFRHLVFDTYGATFDLVFERLEIMSSLPDFSDPSTAPV